MKKNNKKSALRSIGIGAITIFVLIFYAYGFQITKVDLEEAKSEKRQTQLIRIIKALAKPDILEYELKDLIYEVDFFIPCLDEKIAESSNNQITAIPGCGEEGGIITIKGRDLPPNTKGRLYFIPPSGVSLSLGGIETSGDGQFEAEVQLPERASEKMQNIRLVIQERVSGPYISQNALDTWDKILETIFLALLATTFGIIVAIPLSFFAARNLMEDLTNTVLGIALMIIVSPIGIFVGNKFVDLYILTTDMIPENPLILIAAVIGLGLLIFLIFKFLLPEKSENSSSNRIKIFASSLSTIITGILGFQVTYLLSKLLISIGDRVESLGGITQFIGVFISDIGGIVQILLAVLIPIASALMFVNISNQFAKHIINKSKKSLLLIVQILFSGIAGALLFILIAQGIDWLYQIDDSTFTLVIPGIMGGFAGFLLGLFINAKKQLPIGLVIFNISRGIFNVLRSIDAVIMVIVFVVWVGIGPFAGVLALSLHTIAALSKLYSEQIESILEGPLEAVRATGANRLQAIVYAVIPQIVPPYISFTLYRWDINVRMSTIIGLGGGGGIGFLLIQNINLLNYRRASTQMIAIAIVVTIMDTISSRLRDRIT